MMINDNDTATVYVLFPINRNKLTMNNASDSTHCQNKRLQPYSRKHPELVRKITCKLFKEKEIYP